MKVYRMGQWGYLVYRHARHCQMRRAEALARNYPHDASMSPAVDNHEEAPKTTNQDTAA